MLTDISAVMQHFSRFEQALVYAESQLSRPLPPAKFAQMTRWHQALSLAVDTLLKQRASEQFQGNKQVIAGQDLFVPSDSRQKSARQGMSDNEFRHHQSGAWQSYGSQGCGADPLFDRNGPAPARGFIAVPETGERVVHGDGSAKCHDQIRQGCVTGHYSEDVVRGLADLALYLGGQARFADAECLLAPLLENEDDDCELVPNDPKQKSYQRNVATIIRALCLCQVNEHRQAVTLLAQQGCNEGQVFIALAQLLNGENFAAGTTLLNSGQVIPESLIPLGEQLSREINHG